MKTSNTSIAAILFTVIYFLFIVFISLFKGLHFYDIKLHNLYIKHIFIKIDKKLILKANSITIIPQQKVKKDIKSIHNQIYIISKISSMFKELTIKKIKYKNINIPLISYKNETLHIKYPKGDIKGKIQTYKNYTIISNLNIKHEKINIKNLNGKIEYKKNINFDLSFKLNGNKINLNGILDTTDTLYTKITSKKILYTINGFKTHLKNTSLNLSLNLHYLNPKANIKIEELKIKNPSISIHSKDIYAKFNKNLNFKIFNTYISKINQIKDISLSYIKGSYDIKDKLLIISQNNKISLKYKDFILSLKDNQLIYKSIDNLNFTSKKATLTLKNKKLIAKAQNILFLKFYNFITYQINNTIIKNAFLKITNDIIYGYKNLIEIPNIKGYYKNVPFNAKNILINTQIKQAIITNATINKINISPTIIRWYLPNLYLFTHSNDLNIENLKPILKELNITIPINQISGKNKIDANITYNINTKNINYKTQIFSKDAVFKYQDYIFSYKTLSANIENKDLNLKIKDFYIPTSFAKFITDTNISLKKDFLNAFANIKELKVLKFINIKNYKEKIVASLTQKIIYFLNSSIYIDLNDNTIFFLSLKQIINFTPFNKIIQDGKIYLKYNPNSILISGILNLTKPLILNQEKPNNLNAIIKIKDKNITISNDYINAKIINLTDYNISIKNALIDAKTLMFIYDNLQPIFKNDNKQESNASLFIKAKNTNFIYENHKFLSQEATIIYKKELKLHSIYKKSSLKGYTKNKYFLMEGKNYSKEELVALLEFFKKFYSINLDFIFVKSPDNFYTGKIYIKKGIVKELTTLNNIIAFLNTIPALLSLSNPGFSAKGYKIKKGFINYLFYKNILYLKQIKIIGENIDFVGKGYIDFNKKYIKLKLIANLKMKLKKIPIVGKGMSYILFGKDGNINVKILVSGPLENPKVTQDIGKSILLTPFELFKRVMTLPFNLF